MVNDVWLVVVTKDSAKTNIVSGPKSLNTSKLVDEGWYFFPGADKKENFNLSPEKAIKLGSTPTNGMSLYLQSNKFKGIGEKIAKKVVNIFHKRLPELFSLSTKEFAKVVELSEGLAQQIINDWKDNSAFNASYILLRHLGFGDIISKSIHYKFGGSVINFLLTKPYDLVGSVPRLNFTMIDRAVERLDLTIPIEDKMLAATKYCLARVETGGGHTATRADRIHQEVSEYVDVSFDKFEQFIHSHKEHLDIISQSGQKYVRTEHSKIRDLEIAEHLIAIQRNSGNISHQTQSILTNLRLPNNLTLSKEQEQVLEGALSSSVSIITGGPGTGKTTIVIALLMALSKLGLDPKICAPTGKAAKRLAENPGLKLYEPQTIHLMLEKLKAKKNKLLDVLVIDEASMIDINLMLRILEVLDEGSRLILIGDIDQLPPIGPGQVFKDLILSNIFSVGRLTENFRQESGSDISTAARKVISGEFPESGKGQTERDFSFIPEVKEDDLFDLIIDQYFNNLRNMHNFNPLQDIQILTPMRKGKLGIENLNKQIQAQYHKSKKPLIQINKEVHFFQGDKVMETQNNYKKMVMNGDTGTVLRVENDNVVISFDDDEVEYELEEMKSIQLAYAISIHKSQGSEYPAVIIPISSDHSHMLTRNLIYTAITRGRERVILAGDKKAFQVGLDARWKDCRHSLLPLEIKTFAKLHKLV